MSIELHIRVEPLDDSGLPWRDRVTVLRAQLTLIRMRAEQGIAVSVELLAHAERVARSLELEEVSA